MKIAITAETTIDLPKSMLEELEIETVPFTLTMGEKTGLDGEITPEELFEYTKQTGKLPRTSAVNQYQYEEFFKGLFAKGYEAIIHFSLSSDMSSAYSNAVNASKEFANVFIIDSRSLSTGIALLAIYARKLARANKEPKEIVEEVSKRIPYDQASFSLESVDNLYKGGRCSMLAMIGANLLRIKPEIYVREGKMVSGQKYRGPMLKVVQSYVEDTLKEFDNPDYEEVFVTYSTAPEEVVSWTVDRLKKAGFKNVRVTTAGGTISCHCGPHCLGILYINDGPHPLA